MREYGFSLTRFLPHEDQIYDSVLLRKNTAQSKPVFSHILCSDSAFYLGVHNCPRGWKLYGANCYKFVAHPVEKRSWAQARQDCLDYNKDWRESADIAKADLVSITTKAEQDMLQQTFRELGANNTDYWTGLTKQNSTGFYWIDGTYFKYMNWRGASTGNQECVKSSVSYNANQGSWIIASCSQRNNYVCKLPRSKSFRFQSSYSSGETSIVLVSLHHLFPFLKKN